MKQVNPINLRVYIVVTCLVSWALIGGAYALGLPWRGVNMVLLGGLLMWAPGAVAIGMQRRATPGQVRAALRIHLTPNRWWLMAWLMAPMLTLVTLGITLLLPGHSLATDASSIVGLLGDLVPEEAREATAQGIEDLPVHVFWIQLFQGLTGGAVITALFALGEEIGWRGLLDREAHRGGWGFWKSSIAIGALWGLWHWPVIVQGHNYPDHPALGVVLMVLFCVGLGPLFTFVSRMGGSVVAAALAHGTLNATAALPLLVVEGGSDLTRGISSCTGLFVLLCANLALIPLVRRHHDRLRSMWANSP